MTAQWVERSTRISEKFRGRETTLELGLKRIAENALASRIAFEGDHHVVFSLPPKF